ncbi:MAG: M15 family metallopeptidase [Leptospiraceae bacterium]|nr:M15 family metallopeptidase [Leptospiraceae bacterium]
MKLYITILFLNCSVFANDIYLGIPKEKYLMGDYSGSKVHKAFVNKSNGATQLMRPDVAEAFQKMVDAFEKDKGNKTAETIWARSSFRSYYDQKAIWENKYSGKTKMKESVEGKKPEERVALILQYSSAPGTSRHHWGTDIDINSFDNEYFAKGGKGEFLYQWMTTNAHKFGFCQPYNDLKDRNNQGYFLERWHWSYAPISNKLLADWLELYQEKKIIIKGKFSGSETMPVEMPKTYVSSINKTCANVR